ncbi:MAG: AAA family ATPase, partial [Saprospiraceae bacterium]
EVLGCPWVPEYAREYLANLGRAYNVEDLSIIAIRQLEEILAAMNEQWAMGNKQNQEIIESSRHNVLTGDIDYTILNVALTKIKSSFDLHPSSIIIVDGGMMNLRMWARIKYNIVIPLVEDALEKDLTDLYILCRPHQSWEPDALREAPSLLDRVWIYNLYLEELVKSEKEFEIILYQ